jgi:hypothetical protein
MHKNPSPKLILTRETLRALEGVQLSQAAAGAARNSAVCSPFCAVTEGCATF